MPKISSRGSSIKARSVSSNRNVKVGKDYVTVHYRVCGENRVVKISNKSIIASGRAALANVPVIID